jgi:hypothetical protein
MIALFSSGIPAFVRQLAVLRVKPFASRMDFMLGKKMFFVRQSVKRKSVSRIFGPETVSG